MTAYPPETEPKIRAYLEGGRVPWSPGYKEYRRSLFHRILRDDALARALRNGGPLPEGHGFGVDERVVEFPWALSRLDRSSGWLLDAGSALNYPYLLERPELESKKVAIMTLGREWRAERPGVFYASGDLRRTPFPDSTFPWIVCISTLEHIGQDNTMLYTQNARYRENAPLEYRKALRELRRILAPGGKLLLTVPFGRRMELGWMIQFDASGIRDLVDTFAGRLSEARFFRHTPKGWLLSDERECGDCEYYDVHSASGPAPDRAAAARGVACLELEKP